MTQRPTTRRPTTQPPTTEPPKTETESPKLLAREAQAGRSARTPAIALTGVTIGVGVVVCAIVVAAVLVYYFA